MLTGDRRLTWAPPWANGVRAMRWDWDPILIELGALEIRWYGVCFMIGLILCIRTVERSFEDRHLQKEHVSSLSIWLPLGMILGAHLIHLIFYEPGFLGRDAEQLARSFRAMSNGIEAWWSQFKEIRLIQIGSGLASHGGGAGTILALWIFCRKRKQSFFEYADAVMVGASWIIPWVRVGNFFNSEIYGRETDLPWGVVFARRDDLVRHPSQLYEAAIGFALVGLVWWMHKNRAKLKLHRGQTLAGALFLYFLTRFLIEYVKEYQIIATGFPFTMGQMLSTPLVLLFAGLWFWAGKTQPTNASLEEARVAAASDGTEGTADTGKAKTAPGKLPPSKRKKKRKKA